MSLDSPPPPAGPPPAGPQVGADEWVAREAHRREYLPSWLGTAQRQAERIGWWPRLAAAGLAAAALPLIGLGGFQLQVGIDALGVALVSSGQVGPNGIHLPSYLSIPLVILATAGIGVLVGLPSRRLVGDYLAIVTLFFGEAFFEFTNNVAPATLGGPNGIVGIDPISVFGHQITTNTGYYLLLVVVLVLTMAVLRLLEFSRTGRAWRAVREDPLAAGSMT